MADRGFSSSTLTLRISLDDRYREPEQRRAFFRQLLATCALCPTSRRPGRECAAAERLEAMSFFTLDGFANKDDQMVNTRWVSADYFDAMETRVKEGRAIEDSDVEGRPPVVVVNEAFANRYYPGASPVGRRFRIRGPTPATRLGRGRRSSVLWRTFDIRTSRMRHHLRSTAPSIKASLWTVCT